MLRRSFLGCAAGAALAQAPPPAAKVISSASLATLPGTFVEKLRAVARAGIQSVELLGDEHTRWSDAELERAKRTLRAYDLTVDTVAAASDWQATMNVVRKLNASMVLMRGASADALRRSGDLAGRADVTVLVESLRVAKDLNHP